METPPIPPGYAAYPRNTGLGPISPGPERVRLEAISDAWNLIKADFGIWVLTVLIEGAIGFGMAMIFGLAVFFMIANANQSPDAIAHSVPYVLVSILFTILSHTVTSVIGAGVMNLAVRRLRGEYVGLGGMFDFRGRFGPLVISQLLISPLALLPLFGGLLGQWAYPPSEAFGRQFAQIAGQLVAYVPYACGYVAVVFVPLLIIDSGLPVGKAFAVSFRTAMPRFFPILGLLIASGIVAMLGLIACLVGALFTAPIYPVTQAVLYHDFFRPRADAAPLPSY